VLRGRVHRSTPEDLSRTALLVTSLYFLNKVDISYLYHYIRGQMSSYIKLYVIYNVLEVFDRLLCSLGHDIFESMSQWTLAADDSKLDLASLFSLHRPHAAADGEGEVEAGDGWESARTALYIGMAGVYVVAHSTVLLIQVVTLNVAINSQNNALITLLVANNFTELKGHVFKKFDEGSLLQVLCADMVERFQMIVCLSLVTLQNMSKDSNMYKAEWVQSWFTMVVIVWLTEHLVDWVKHSFVTKFNKIEPEVYDRYREVIWEHVCNAWRLRQPHRVAKHVGFVSLPLACVAARVVQHSLPPSWLSSLLHHSHLLGPLLVLWWLSLCLVKTLVNLFLLGHACRAHHAMKTRRKQPPLSPRGPKPAGPRGRGLRDKTPHATPHLGPHAAGGGGGEVSDKNRERVQELMAVDVFTRALKVAPEPAAAAAEAKPAGGAAGDGAGADSSDGMPELSLERELRLERTYLTGAEEFN
jgi:hypothetical protein